MRTIEVTATERLRALLTERGVEWEDMSALGFLATLWHSDDAACTALEGADDIPHGKVSVQACLTPEQAVEATLGRGTCHAVFEVDAMSEDERIGEFVCSECGETLNAGHGEFPRYCPNCGAKVTDG